jgi:hypothetical protein
MRLLELIASNPAWDKIKVMAIYRLCRVAVLLAALILTICFPAFTQTVSFADFSSPAGLKLAGTAAIAKTDDGAVLRLTKATCCSAGSAFTAKAVPFLISADTFSTFFQFRLTNPGGLSAADGIVFVLRTAATPALGKAGEFEGYDGIGQSLGVKFDTFRNEGEINGNHVSIQTNGTVREEFSQTPYSVQVCSAPVGVAGCMANGHIWSVWIDYDGVNLHVALADNSTVRSADLITAPLSLPALFNYAAGVSAGFTAGTGGGFENHDILNWRYNNTYSPTPEGTQQALPSVTLPPPQS